MEYRKFHRHRIFSVILAAFILTSCDVIFPHLYCENLASKLRADKKARLYIEDWVNKNSLNRGFVRKDDPKLITGPRFGVYGGYGPCEPQSICYKSDFDWRILGFDEEARAKIRLIRATEPDGDDGQIIKLESIYFYEHHRQGVLYDVSKIGELGIGAPYDTVIKVSEKISVICMDR